ncbi:MAG: hypothetical protein KDB14_09365, partial [Planctomycetales bacterium]|nr:hypothetical protein [Planctomycetales bacterium]
MEQVLDPETRELTTSRLRLCSDVVVAPRTRGEEIYYHIESRSQGTFFRVGYAEYVFLSLLDGRHSVAQATTLAVRTLGAKALSQRQAVQTADWALRQRLVQPAGIGEGLAEPEKPGTSRWQKYNPFWLKLPLGSPDRLLSALTPLVGWLFSPIATLLGCAFMLWGAMTLLSHSAEFGASAATVLAPNNWLWLAAAWVVLKLVHELGHGLACKWHGGEVRDVGVIFVLFAPLAYVDVTSCWRFPNRWQRIHVAAAGMYVELLLASLAAILWTQTDSVATRHLLHNVVIMASLSTLLFNANPLMRFDGYYILSDLLGAPNLAEEGSRAVSGGAAWLFFGKPLSSPRQLGARPWLIRIYGLLSLGWRVLVCASLLAAAAVLWHGAGLLLAAAG